LIEPDLKMRGSRSAATALLEHNTPDHPGAKALAIAGMGQTPAGPKGLQESGCGDVGQTRGYAALQLARWNRL